MKKAVYPLEQISLIKQKRLEEAEKTLKQKKEALEIEQKKLQEAQKKLEEVKKHKTEKLTLYMKEVDEGTTSDKIAIHERYIKEIVEEELKVERKRVDTQKKAVEKAEKELEAARIERLKKNQEVEKMALHKKEWEKEIKLELNRLESIETDELGSNIHSLRKRRSSENE
jgi:hypothetical protein